MRVEQQQRCSKDSLSLAVVIPFLAVTEKSRELDRIIKYRICFPCPRKISGCYDTFWDLKIAGTLSFSSLARGFSAEVELSLGVDLQWLFTTIASKAM